MRVSPGLMTFLVGLVVLAIAGLMYQQQLVSSGRVGNGNGVAAATAEPTKYMCPMRCVELDEPGDCPVCGMDMVAMEATPLPAAAVEQELYTCPMHPQVEQDHSGTCPICGMELVLKAVDTSAVSAETREMVSTVRLSPLQSVLADIQAIHPTLEHMEIKIQSIGEVAIPEDRVESLVSWQAGRVDRLALRKTGGEVRRNDRILDIYSEELVQAQEEYLLALDAVMKLSNSGYESIASSTERLLDAARRKLLRLGLTAGQLAELESTGEVRDNVPVYATHGGVVLEKFVTEGMYVREGERLFTVADLSTVWVKLEIYESDMPRLQAGDAVTMFCPIHPGMLFQGRIDLIEPSLTESTRTHRARVIVKNPDFILRPGMIMEAELTVDHGELLALPRNAVLHTGDGDLVYVLAGPNQWEPRRITTGHDFGDLVQILDGLGPDEAVAGTAVFLLDSEAQLKGVPRPLDESATGSDQQTGAETHDSHAQH